ncbi:MAG TPA: phosphoglucosamine mutase [Candidatus Binatia bacterium]|jgi:phosphoglucosamine mutase|nr:phosphoglucosamine mutase [Candidatus Binatia bacterium]
MGERRLFGTDGVRGIANVEPMTSETALRLGRALAYVSKRAQRRHKILIGKDTRLSGYMLETAMASGICSMGVDVLLVGPLPTPGIAFLTRSLRADAGVVISASHNPFQDNGIKLFSGAGFKFPDELELEIEDLVLGDSIDALRPTATEIGKAFRIDDAVGRYNVFAKNCFPRTLTLDGLTLAVDCGHGAAYRVAPEVLEELGARVIPLGVAPDGENINQNCGALHPEHLAKAVRAHGAQAGIALDGDADRCILVDEQGEIVDGDEVMALLATQLHERGELAHGTLVTTVMSNLGLHVALRDRQIKVATTPVGDRYVVEEMVRGGFNLGGEQSGHVVFLDHNTTGDGLITALSVLALMVERGKPLSELRQVMRRFPQVLVNLRVTSKPSVETLPAVAAAIAKAEKSLGDRGRVLVRYSGTEALLRVMIEGEREVVIRDMADAIADAARAAIGA